VLGPGLGPVLGLVLDPELGPVCHAGTVDDLTWGALTMTLTAIGGFYTWWAYHHRGATPALRGLALTLLPAAAWLTGTLRMFSRIADAVTDWAVHLAFSPKVWLGVILAALSVALFLLSGFLRDRGLGGGTPRRTEATSRAPDRNALAKGQAAGRKDVQTDALTGDGLDDEIAAILKRRGIS
jgi:hypothetical protein